MKTEPISALCANCHCPQHKHADSKCLYEPTEFKHFRCVHCDVELHLYDIHTFRICNNCTDQGKSLHKADILGRYVVGDE